MHCSVFWSMCHISRVYLPLVDNKSLSRLTREFMSMLNCITIALQGKWFKSFRNTKFFLFSLFDYFSFWAFEIVFLAGIDLLFGYNSSVFHSFLRIVFQDFPCYVVLFRRLTLFFVLHSFSQQSWKSQIFWINCSSHYWFRTRNVFSRSLYQKFFCMIRFWSYVTYITS